MSNTFGFCLFNVCKVPNWLNTIIAHWLKYQTCSADLEFRSGFCFMFTEFLPVQFANLNDLDVNICVIYLISKKFPWIAQLGFGQDIILDLMIESFSANLIWWSYFRVYWATIRLKKTSNIFEEDLKVNLLTLQHPLLLSLA